MDATYALVTRLEAKPTKAQEVADLLVSGLGDVEEEPGVTAWFAVRFSVLEFGLYMAFPDEVGQTGSSCRQGSHRAQSQCPSVRGNAGIRNSRCPRRETSG